MSVKPEYVVPTVVGACAAVVGAALGYRLAKTFDIYNKSQRTMNPLVKYASDHTVKFTPAQAKLHEVTLKHKRARMMGSPDELHLLASICRAIGAKKTLDIEYVVPTVVGACAAVVGAALGYRLAKTFDIYNKSQRTMNPLVKYASDHTVKFTPAQAKLHEVTLKHKRARMMGSPDELHLLASICRAIGAKKTLDIGVFTGVSALSIAQVLPEDGKLVACDISAEYPEIGKPFWKEAGVDKKIDLQIAPADVTLRKLLDKGEAGTYDFAFIDAIKVEYDTYYELCLKLIRPGGLIVFDNMIWGGQVINSANNTETVLACRQLNDKLHNDDRVDSTLLLIGDGTVLAFKR